ncbi:MAG: alpha/beta fold hydrolase [Burkholderiales bacterium]
MPRIALTRRWLVAVAIVAATLGGCATLDHEQRRLIFQPAKETWWAGAQAAEGMRPVWIDFRSTASGTPERLHALWLANENPDAPVLLYLHGARWDVTGSAPRVRRMAALGYAVLAIDYRGFGKSSGADELPSEASAYEDARAAWDWIAREHPQKRRYIFGHSLGSAIAVDLASQVDDASGLIVEGSFTSIPDVFSTQPWGWLPVTGLITQRFDAASRIGKVHVPVLVVHGSADTLIHPELGRALYEQARAPKRFVLVEGGSHHNANALGQGQYAAALHELFGPTL